jgi:hypothetical protein
MVHHLAFRKKCPRFDWAPARRGGHTNARGARHSVFLPREVLAGKHHLRPNAGALPDQPPLSGPGGMLV